MSLCDQCVSREAYEWHEDKSDGGDGDLYLELCRRCHVEMHHPPRTSRAHKEQARQAATTCDSRTRMELNRYPAGVYAEDKVSL
jgi:hypothetical protein